MATVPLGDQRLAGQPILPSFIVMPKAIVEPSALKESGSRQIITVLEQCERVVRPVHSRQQHGPLQVDVGAALSRDLLGDIELPFGGCEIAEAFLGLGEIDGRFECCRIGLVAASRSARASFNRPLRMLAWPSPVRSCG